ncbi:ABC transporter permease [Clostridium sp. AL.422]|uniref:ABC transporter permease n=1 Tax=Clostridium TaxID=1485 RepID=UPI00293DD726|nr:MULTISPECIES: ABC transporter permease [unclassified Clostridium]MDV4150206.1 ABC transporter permease [Clostridium sp. AL.422]
MKKNKIGFNIQTFNFPIVLGFTVSLISLFIAISLFKTNFDFFNDTNIYWNNKVSLNIKMKSKINSNSFYKKLNEGGIYYLNQDEIYKRDIKNINYVKGIHDIDLSEIIPLYSGEFLNEEEVNSEEKVVMIGKYLEKFTYKKDEKIYIDIYNEEYEVKGFIGRKGESKYSIYILMPSKTYNKVLNTEETDSYVIEVDKKTNKEIVDKINNIFKDDIIDINVNYTQLNKPIAKAFELEKNILTNLSIAIIFSIVCSITFVLLWVGKISKNISIRKALGANGNDIFMFVFKNLTQMLIISVIIALILSYGLLSIAIRYIAIFSISLNISVILQSILMLIILIIILSRILLKKFSKMDISNLLRS